MSELMRPQIVDVRSTQQSDYEKRLVARHGALHFNPARHILAAKEQARSKPHIPTADFLAWMRHFSGGNPPLSSDWGDNWHNIITAFNQAEGVTFHPRLVNAAITHPVVEVAARAEETQLLNDRQLSFLMIRPEISSTYAMHILDNQLSRMRQSLRQKYSDKEVALLEQKRKQDVLQIISYLAEDQTREPQIRSDSQVSSLHQEAFSQFLSEGTYRPEKLESMMAHRMEVAKSPKEIPQLYPFAFHFLELDD